MGKLEIFIGLMDMTFGGKFELRLLSGQKELN